MRFYFGLIFLCLSLLALSCSREIVPLTPRKTFETYIRALKMKDTTTMKLLLSADTIKMHEKEAKAMGITVDEIVKRETIFSEGQKVVELRNEKIDGDKATLEVKNSMRRWETVYFIRENGDWKIDKKAYADQLLKEIEEENRQVDEEMNLNRTIPFETVSPFPTPPFDATNSNDILR